MLSLLLTFLLAGAGAVLLFFAIGLSVTTWWFAPALLALVLLLRRAHRHWQAEQQ
jgi:hypothetical protein